MKVKLVSGALLALGLSTFAHAGDSAELARRIFIRLTGAPLLAGDSRLEQMRAQIDAGQLAQAAAIAVEDDHFFNVTLKNWATPMSNKDETAYGEFTDFQAMIIGVARDDLDARTLLTGNFTYAATRRSDLPKPSALNNDHYRELDKRRSNFRNDLVRIEPQRADLPDAAGLLTTRAWAEAHYKMGTNRRSVEYTFREFMCTPITTWRDVGLPDHRVRRDVDRNPGGNPSTFQNLCRSCHAPMDGMAGAFARFDFVSITDAVTGQPSGKMIYVGPVGVAAKYNQNVTVYPEGYITTDDSWVNMAIYNHNESFGWKGALSGNGVNAFGRMISESDGYAACMVKRSFKEICKREADSSDDAVTGALAEKFKSGGYRLKKLFAETAAAPGCLTDAGGSK